VTAWNHLAKKRIALPQLTVEAFGDTVKGDSIRSNFTSLCIGQGMIPHAKLRRGLKAVQDVIRNLKRADRVTITQGEHPHLLVGFEVIGEELFFLAVSCVIN
jgi:hypothetical protein